MKGGNKNIESTCEITNTISVSPWLEIREWGGGGGGTPPYMYVLNGYVRHPRVWFLSQFDLK